MQLEAQFLEAIARDLGNSPEQLKAEGSIQRFGTKDGKRDDAGWCVFFTDGDRAGGAYGDWRSDTTYKWFSSNCDVGDRIEMQRKQKKVNAKRQTMLYCEVREKLKNYQKPPLTPTTYTEAKAIDCDDRLIGERCGSHNDCLIIPMRDISKTLWNQQKIYPDGTKRFMKGGKTSGLFQMLGSAKSGTVYICEGWATACSIYLATRKMVVCAFSAHNMLEVSKLISEQMLTARIIIAADNDVPGEDAARKSAQYCSNLVSTPPEVGSDWNDYFVAHGPAATQQMIDSRLCEVAVQSAGKQERGESLPPSEEPKVTDSPTLTAARRIMSEPERPDWNRTGLLDVIADAAEASGAATGSDPVLFSNAAMAVLGAAIHDHVRVMLKHSENFSQHCQLWCTTIAKSGAGKSPMAKKALAPLKAIAKDASVEILKQSELLDDARHQYKESLKQFRKGEIEEKPEQPNPGDYQMPRYLIMDATTEAICDIQSKWSGGSLFVADELASLMGSMDAYRSSGGKDEGFWLTAYDGGVYRVDRKGADSSRAVPNLSIGLLAGIQPKVAANLFKATGSNGFIERQMLAVARDRILPDESVGDINELHRWDQLVRKVHAASIRPRELTLSPGADEIRKRLNRWCVEHSIGEQQGMVSHLNKFPALFGRIIIIYHLSQGNDFDSDDMVSRETAQLAFDYLTAHQFPHSKNAFDYISEAREYLPHLTQLAHFVESHPFDTIELSELRGALVGANQSQFKNTVEMLKARGYLIPADELGRGFGFAINPAIKKAP